MPKAIDLTGKRFGKLLVTSAQGRDKWGQYLWDCLCDCGNTRLIVGGNLRRKNGDVSCGCLRNVRIGNATRTHGKSQTKDYRKEIDRTKRFKKYGMSEEDFQTLLKKQDSRCAICGVIPARVSNRLHDGLHIDHCHVSGRVRGLLCSNCNTGIGMLKDSEKILQAAINYLR